MPRPAAPERMATGSPASTTPKIERITCDLKRPLTDPPMPIMAASLSAGGHLRVGMEDNVVFARGHVVQHNDELVARAAELATLMQRPPLATEQARELLGVKDRRSR